MKKILLFVLVIASTLFAQNKKTLIYYFDDGEPLTPVTSNLVAYYTPTGLTASGWLDKAATPHNLTFSGGVTINSSALNGYAGATFDGINGYAYSADFSLPKPITIYIVFKDITRTTGETVFSGKTAGLTEIDQSTSATNHYASAGSALGLSNSTLSYKVITVVFNGASSFIQRDKQTGVSGSTGAGGTGVNANPLFTNNVKIGDINRLDISSSSPAIDAGVSEWWESWIESKGLPTTDIHGNPRDWSNPDAGAMEYQSGVADTVPSFSFTALNNRELSTAYIGNATFSGTDSTFTVYTTTGARFNINSNTSLTTTPKTAVNGDVVYVENISSASYSTGTTETIVAGGVSRSFNVTTKSEPVLTSGTKKVRLSNGKVLKDSSGKVIKVQ